ncbi:MAG: alpha/beta hydrolase [Dehalococcoidia bacterium]|nr:MAG: alpha/beta hydrolase [Dehalococcoidia bacterium]
MENERPIRLVVDGAPLEGNLVIPKKAKGIVVFAHGSGSSRNSPRNRFVAGVLQEAGLATLLFDLLTPKEEQIDSVTGHLRFDIDFLARRLVGAVDWVARNKDTQSLNVGCFGASTGAAAALVAAAERPQTVKAVVSRGGRPDLAASSLPRVKAPVLLVVGGLDTQVIELNQQTLDKLTSVKELSLVPGATHLFEEQGALPQVANLAAAWFARYLGNPKG